MPAKKPRQPTSEVDLKTKPVAIFQKSVFTITFGIELVGFTEVQDCDDDGWLDLTPCSNGVKLHYELYPDFAYDIDILIWPQCVKIWCGDKNVWCRTWEHSNSRWAVFSIRHAIPVRVLEMQHHILIITPSFGLANLGPNARNDKTSRVYFPDLKSNEKVYFAQVICEDETLQQFLYKLIWEYIEPNIPASIYDGLLDAPMNVSDYRHQDTIIMKIQDPNVMKREELNKPVSFTKGSKIAVNKAGLGMAKLGYELHLSGDCLLSGAGHLVAFKEKGSPPNDQGKIYAFMSSNNLPASDDFPIIFVNINDLESVPVKKFLEHRVYAIYTQWKVGKDLHKSELKTINEESSVFFNDHHATPLSYENGLKHINIFADRFFEIELRGVRTPEVQLKSSELFGTNVRDKFYDKNKIKRVIAEEQDFLLRGVRTPEVQLKSSELFGTNVRDKFYDKNKIKRVIAEEQDFLIAVCKIDIKSLAFGKNGLVQGEFSLHPPVVEVEEIKRPELCTTDINAVRRPLVPKIVIDIPTILEAQMTLSASIGYVGCQVKKIESYFSRIFCVVHNAPAAIKLFHLTMEINEELVKQNRYEDVLTGFAIDTGDVMFFYVEGPKGKEICYFWKATKHCFDSVKIHYSSEAKYSTRIYEGLLETVKPFMILKMYVPLKELLACPPAYVRPTLPLPTRSGILKLDFILKRDFQEPLNLSDLLTMRELASMTMEVGAAMKDSDYDSKPIHILPGTPRPKPPTRPMGSPTGSPDISPKDKQSSNSQLKKQTSKNRVTKR